MSAEDKRQQTFDNSLLPEWAIHEEDQEGLNAFFNEPADRGEAETAFAIPRGDIGVHEPSPVARPQIGLEPEPAVEFEPAPEPVVAPDPESEPAAAPEPELESKPAAVFDFAPEPVVAPEPEPEPELEVAPAPEPEQDLAAESAAAEEEPEAAHNAAAPRRADFAKFRCIYESQDGQLALYEDENGHLTAVNTNRFI